MECLLVTPSRGGCSVNLPPPSPFEKQQLFHTPLSFTGLRGLAGLAKNPVESFSTHKDARLSRVFSFPFPDALLAWSLKRIWICGLRFKLCDRLKGQQHGLFEPTALSRPKIHLGTKRRGTRQDWGWGKGGSRIPPPSSYQPAFLWSIFHYSKVKRVHMWVNSAGLKSKEKKTIVPKCRAQSNFAPKEKLLMQDIQHATESETERKDAIVVCGCHSKKLGCYLRNREQELLGTAFAICATMTVH